jgi:hypothetical protein
VTQAGQEGPAAVNGFGQLAAHRELIFGGVNGFGGRGIPKANFLDGLDGDLGGQLFGQKGAQFLRGKGSPRAGQEFQIQDFAIAFLADGQGVGVGQAGHGVVAAAEGQR